MEDFPLRCWRKDSVTSEPQILLWSLNSGLSALIAIANRIRSFPSLIQRSNYSCRTETKKYTSLAHLQKINTGMTFQHILTDEEEKLRTSSRMWKKRKLHRENDLCSAILCMRSRSTGMNVREMPCKRMSTFPRPCKRMNVMSTV